MCNERAAYIPRDISFKPHCWADIKTYSIVCLPLPKKRTPYVNCYSFTLGCVAKRNFVIILNGDCVQNSSVNKSFFDVAMVTSCVSEMNERSFSLMIESQKKVLRTHRIAFIVSSVKVLQNFRVKTLLEN